MTHTYKLVYAAGAGIALLAAGPTVAQSHEHNAAPQAVSPASAKPACPMNTAMGGGGNADMTQHMAQMRQMMQQMHTDMQGVHDQMKQMRQQMEHIQQRR